MHVSLSLAAVGLVLLLGTPAQAQSAEAVDPAAKANLLDQAQRHVDEATQHYQRGDYEAALAALRRAEGLAVQAEDPGLPNIRFNIARCLEQLERWSEAMEAYDAYNQLPDDPHRKERAWEAMRTLRRKVFGTLAVACDPRGAQIQIEGLTKGAVACPWQTTQAKPGTYTVGASYPGFIDASKPVTVVAGGAANVEIALQRDPDAASLVGVSTTPTEPASEINIWPWAAIGAGAVALGVGGFFTSRAAGDRDDAEDLPPTPDRDDLVDSFEQNRTLAFAMYGTGAAFVAGGILLFFLTGDDAPAEGADAFRFVPSPDGVRVEF